MTITDRAKQLFVRWEADEVGKANLRDFLESVSGELFTNLMHTLQSPTDLPDLIPGIDPCKLEASRYDQLVGWNRCLAQIRVLAYGEEVPQEELTPFAHYGFEIAENNKDN